MPSRKVLIVEDDIDLQGLLALILRRSQVDFDLVSSAEDALMMLASGEYCGVVTDLAMRGMDGWMLMDKMRQDLKTQDVWCIAITSYHDASVEEAALEAGFSAYHRKPLDIKTFVGQIKNRLNMPPVRSNVRTEGMDCWQ